MMVMLVKPAVSADDDVVANDVAVVVVVDSVVIAVVVVAAVVVAGIVVVVVVVDVGCATTVGGLFFLRKEAISLSTILLEYPLFIKICLLLLISIINSDCSEHKFFAR